MGIAHLILAKPAAMELVDKVTPRQAMVDNCSNPPQ
jgi:hypothetical protein